MRGIAALHFPILAQHLARALRHNQHGGHAEFVRDGEVARKILEHRCARRVDAMYVVLRASNHSEFAYTGPDQPAPASRAGQRVATYFALAWLDRALSRARIPRRRSANARLLAARFDRSVDRSSIGLGAWDPATMTNHPYLIAGNRIAAAVSSYYVSRYAFGGHACGDMRAGCG